MEPCSKISLLLVDERVKVVEMKGMKDGSWNIVTRSQRRKS